MVNIVNIHGAVIMIELLCREWACASEIDGEKYCYFCGTTQAAADTSHGQHEKNCPYILAQAFLLAYRNDGVEAIISAAPFGITRVDGITAFPTSTSRADRAVKIIDELLVLFQLYPQDYGIINDALNLIAETRRNNPQHPITASLANFMAEKGLI